MGLPMEVLGVSSMARYERAGGKVQGRQSLPRIDDELKAEEGNARHFLALRPCVRSTARHDSEEDSQCCFDGAGTFPRESLRYLDQREIAHANWGCLPWRGVATVIVTDFDKSSPANKTPKPGQTLPAPGLLHATPVGGASFGFTLPRQPCASANCAGLFPPVDMALSKQR